MVAVLSFMGNHPVLTFFLAVIIGSTITSVTKAIFCKCECNDDEDENDGA